MSGLEKTVRRLSAIAAWLIYPLCILRTLWHKPWRETFAERSGRGGWIGLPVKGANPRVWFHGASVGEIVGMSTVLKSFRELYPHIEILITTTSTTGREEVKKRALADYCCLLPLDSPSIVAQVIDRVQPNLFVVTETEIWPNLFFALARKRIPICSINTRISEYSFPRYRLLRWFLRPVLQTVNAFLVQNEVDKERLCYLGAPRNRVWVSGNTKYDFRVDQMTLDAKQELFLNFGLDAKRPCFVAGSVRPGEDEQVLAAYLSLRQVVPGLQFILVPRHPERFEGAAEMLRSKAVVFHRRSAGVPDKPCSVLLLDSLGELRHAYALASVAFVGATLVDVGGHNPFEPAAYKVPVIVGPYTRNVKDAVAELKQAGGLFEVSSQAELEQVLTRLMTDESARVRAGQTAFDVWQRNIGASALVIEQLEQYMGSGMSAKLETAAHCYPERRVRGIR